MCSWWPHRVSLNYLVPGSRDAHAMWNTTGAPTVLVLSLVTLNGHRCGPSIRYTPSGGATGAGATGRAPWPTPFAIIEAMAARIRHASKTPETQRRRAGRLAPNCTTSSDPSPGTAMADDFTPWAGESRLFRETDVDALDRCYLAAWSCCSMRARGPGSSSFSSASVRFRWASGSAGTRGS
jgi:hypothetical protein